MQNGKRFRSCAKAIIFVALGFFATFQTANACTLAIKSLGVSICTADTAWQHRGNGPSDLTFYNSERDVAGRLQVYKGGTRDSLTAERVAQVIASSDSAETENFALLGKRQMPNGNFVYTATGTIQGRSFVYVNTISVGVENTLRVLTWRQGTELTNQDREMHLAFGQLLKTEE